MVIEPEITWMHDETSHVSKLPEMHKAIKQAGILAYNAALTKHFISSLLGYTNLCGSAEESNLGAVLGACQHARQRSISPLVACVISI